VTDIVASVLTEYAGAQLASFFPDLPIDRLSLAPAEGPCHYPRSIFYRFPVVVGGQPTGRAALAKITRRPGEEHLDQIIADTELLRRATEEYESMRRLHLYFSERNDPMCGNIRPLGYLPAANAIFSEELSARTLRDLVMPALGLRRSVDETKALAYVRQSGYWLRIFHEMPAEPRWQQFDRDEYLSKARSYLTRLEKLGVPATSCYQLYIKIADFIADNHLAERELLFGWRHGDYNLRNILVGTTGKIIGFDTKMRRFCPVWEDVAIFLVELRAHKGLVLSRGRFYDLERIQAWEQAFLDGYRGNTTIDTAFLSLYRALYALRKWVLDLEMYGNKIKAGLWVGHALINDYFSLLISGALALSLAFWNDIALILNLPTHFS
jgi:hypothetical protein